MNEVQTLLKPRLLQQYLDNAGSFGVGLERTALRSESLQMRELLAFASTHGTLTWERLKVQVLQRAVSAHSLDLQWLGRLAHTVALQNVRASDTDFAIEAFTLLNSVAEQGDKPRRFNKLLAELLFEEGRLEELDALILQYPDIKSHYFSYIAVDSRSPFIRGDGTAREYDRWLEGFNRQFIRNGLTPVFLNSSEGTPFNRLDSLPEHGPQLPGPLVTVIMTSFKPVREDILLSARSILKQTWKNIELLIVDDASPADSAPVLDELEALDDRVRVIRLEVNGGTYAARNVGISQARGEFITGQDADDWSHPQRIETQVNHLLRNPQRPGNQVYTVNMTEDLVRIRRGYFPFIPSAPTLMVRTPIMRELGGYLPARKAADNEMRDRISALAGTDVYQISDPLIFMRILPDSLSRSDFRAGWQHPARRAFWSSYKTWHARAKPAELRRAAGQASPIYIPPRFTSPPDSPQTLDAVFVADWCELGETQELALEEIRRLLKDGRRVGVMHMENALHLSEYSRTFIAPVQELISQGKVASVLADEDFYRVHLVLVRNPQLLEFVPDGSVAFDVGTVAVIAGKKPWDSADFQVHYVPKDCATNAQVFFGVRPTWIAQSSDVLSELKGFVEPDELLEQLHVTRVNAAQWKVRRTRHRNTRPVIGRWAGDREVLWPDSPETIEQIYPTDGSADVRLYGDPSSALRALGSARLPASWLSFRQHEISRRTYYRSVDFFVHFDRGSEAPDVSLAVLEALASGCIVVLPPAYLPIYGDAAVYADAHDVRSTVNFYMERPSEYLRQSQQGIEFASTYGAHVSDDPVQQLLRHADHASEVLSR
ncbi:glycosyltransferase family 2 protein [Nesterenkonia massiliensis]|uniref:glycosyltransferase family 2 protein n=1 Tax=Nesterenkonia massiliensis TaxID=1232429 RepID=UPI000408438B|nr:glycosyltransferase family 2 protein [Nesterenkonia massiliensis]